MSLITVWLQVRVLPGLPAFASFGSTSPCHEHRAKRTEDVVRQTYDALAAGKSEIMADKGTAMVKGTLAAEVPGYITPPPGL